MIFCESFAEVFGFIGRFRLCDSLNCNVLIEYVGGERNDGFNPGVPHPTRIDQRNRTTVTVADKDSLIDPGGIEKFWQDYKSLMMHKIYWPGQRDGV